MATGQKRHEAMSREELIRELEALERPFESGEVDTPDTLLRESLDRYADLYEFAPCGYVTLDAAGIIVEVNHTAATLFGEVKKAIEGMPLARWVVNEDRRVLLEHLRVVRADRVSGTIELDLVVGDDRRRVHAGLISKVVPARAKDQILLRSIILDLTERDRARAEEVRLRLQKERAEAASEAKGRFLAMLSHELRTPLTPILAAASELEARRDLPDDVARMVAMIRRNAELEAGLVDDLLDLTRIETGKIRIAYEPVDLHEVIESVVAMCNGDVAAKGVALSVDYGVPEPFVNGDTTRLHQIVWNVLSNAIRHTPAGGSVRISTRPDAEMLSVVVADSGEGIDPASLPRLFSPFEQLEEGPRRIGALGLGLAITRGLVDAHGGAIAAYSEGKGRGTKFEVLLPFSGSASRPVERHRPSQPPIALEAAQVRILLVEDNADTAELITLLLRRTGFVVRTALSLREARELMDDDVSLVITDLGLPDGTGVELVEEFRRSREVPAIALTGYGSDADVAQTTAAGFSAHLTKPVRYEELVRAIESVRK